MVMELLAPAGSFNVFKIAVNRGADAIYLAGQNFGARAYAENFSIEEIKKSVEYAHLNNVKVFVTVNTLINNFEVIDLLKYIFNLYKIGVDAVIVQDFGVLKLINTVFPQIKVHASTQMGLNNYYSILWASKNGVSRAIFPREISVDEISHIHSKLKENDINMELEVFSHGALCYSISGNCYISSLNNGRSGNRGACTQPCRREYKLKYKGYNIDNGYLLSTHDLNVSDDIETLQKAGIDSIKLEGRMKSEDYVGTIVNSYRNIIDKKEGNFKDDLNFVFNRKFTRGYLLNQSPGEVMGRKSSGHIGYYIGEIVEIDDENLKANNNSKTNKRIKNTKYTSNNNSKANKQSKNTKYTSNNNSKANKQSKNTKYTSNNNSKATENFKGFKNKEDENDSEEFIKTTKKIKISKENPVDIQIGDGIAFKIGKKIKGIYIDDIIEQNDDYIIFNTTRNVRLGDKVFISYSHSINKELKKHKKEHIQSKIPITFNIYLDDNLHVNIVAKFYLKESHKIEFNYKSRQTFEKAINRPIGLEEVKKQLSKTGNTPFYIEEINIKDYPNDLFIPTSKLNEIRREILDKASQHLLNYYKPYRNQIKETKNNLTNFIKKYNAKEIKQSNTELGISVFVDNIELVEIASNYHIKKIYFDPSYLYNNPKDYFKNIKDILIDAYIKSDSTEFVWVLPSFISEEEINKCIEIHEDLKAKEFNIGIMSDVPGIGNLFNSNIHGNHNLNVWNSFACENLSNSGFNSSILSSEISHDEINQLKSKLETDDDFNLELIVHGNLEVMESKDDFSNLNNGKNLIIDEASDYAILEDKKRKKFKYKVLFDFNKKSHFRNKDCLCLIDELGRIKNLGLSSIILDCRFSNKNYTSRIISLYLEGLKNTNKKNLNSLKKEVHSLTHSYLSKGNFLDGRIHEKDKK
ncbi:DUF3656 domain-containing protein [Methanobrevibacter sp. TMH8]|uniref:U32 family peptidase n=1 Tax=Methanobrevibacter sp. TMH8 TaxID=2848611 RepID=UPI001CCD1721|nr:U32 family peptidase [Methanobrevibacter sp. TMH8]MBZ9569956.1 DUF3656 domain-containing protein [Methanobrevibacter sp. TMH8]